MSRYLTVTRPLCIDLFAGLSGWGDGAVAAGYHCVGFDLVDMCRVLELKRPDGCSLVRQDVRTLHGRQFREAALIVASPPCEAYSYRAMPWRRAKALPPPDNTLFNACFRIQREACEAAGRYIPMVVENVRGAQEWVGKASWHYGSYYLWGDVPALMPITRHPEHCHKGSGSGAAWFNANLCAYGSRTRKRKAASALIARIPAELARWIAEAWKPRDHTW